MNTDYLPRCQECLTRPAEVRGDFFFCSSCIRRKYVDVGGTGQSCSSFSCKSEPSRYPGRSWVGDGVDYNIGLDGTIFLREVCPKCFEADQETDVRKEMNMLRRKCFDLENREKERIKTELEELKAKCSLEESPRKRRRI